jgi:hypothetical protein
MAKKSGNEHPDVQRQEKYPMPGTDLGLTTAIPFNEAFDVDLSGGFTDAVPGRGDMCSNMSYVMGDRPETLIPAANPTRQRK